MSGSGFFFNLLSIILIDILLAGDNAVVIAMAVRSLPPANRRLGMAVGGGGAVVLRIVLTFFAARLLELHFVKLIGGLLIVWIAVKLLIEKPEDEANLHAADSIRQAIWMILVADVTMSLDNILAVAATSNGNLLLLSVGLALSISFVVFTSSFLIRVMDHYPIVIWIGGAILGRVAGEMIVTDPSVVRLLDLSPPVQMGAQLCIAFGVVLGSWIAVRNRAKRTQTS